MCARLLICATVLALIAVNQADAAMSMDQIQKTAMNLRNVCVGKVNADAEIVAGMQKGAFPDDRALKCYTHCIMKTIRTFKNGRVDTDMMIKQIDMMMPPDLAAIMKDTTLKCAAALSPGSDDCETAFQQVKCSYETDPNHFFFP